jgi:tetratricopeptide (TPR) repeat protein
MANKCLTVAVQLAGLDSADTVFYHNRIAMIQADQLDNPISAVQHLLAAKYIAEMSGGPNHPELINTYLRLGDIYHKKGIFNVALECYYRAKIRTCDVGRQARITASMAEVLAKSGHLEQAVNEQRTVAKVVEQIFGPEDENSVDAKKVLEKYLRELTTAKVKAAMDLRAIEESRAKMANLKIKAEPSAGNQNEKGNQGKDQKRGKGDVKKGDQQKSTVKK